MQGNWGEDTPIRNIPYYVWMKEQGITNPNKIDTKIAFLHSQGFDKSKHKLANADQIVMIMGYCEDMYYLWEILDKNKRKFPIDKPSTIC
jgi:hypothetical protein